MNNKFVKIFFGKSNFKLDNDVPKVYLIKMAIYYLLSLLRGNYNKIFLKKSGKRIYIGHKVKLISRNKIVFGENVRIGDYTTINAISKNGLIIGNNVKIGNNTVIMITGSMQAIGKGVKIGNNSSFSENTFWGASGGIEIGSDVIAGQNVRFHAENHIFSDLDKLIRDQGVTHKGIKVGNNCWIGSGVVFLDGAEIGNGSVVAANAVVTGKFPENVIVGGIPAKIIKSREDF